MSRPSGVASERLEELRRSFDQSFAEAPPTGTRDLVDLLAVRIAGDRFAFRLEDVAALVVGRRILALPSPSPEFLGVVGFRGLIVPVYSLRRLLGYPWGEAPRWAILTATEDRVGLAFDDYEGYLRIPGTLVAPPDRLDVMPPHIRDVAHPADATRAVVSVASALTSIKRRACPEGPPKE